MIDRFLTYLRCELNYSEHTVRAYGSDLNMLADFLTGGKPEEFDPASVTLGDLRAWIAHQGEKNLSARTLRRRTLAARTFFHYLRLTGLIERNPAADLSLPRMPQPLPVFIRDAELERILSPEAFDTEDFREFRDKLIIELLYGTGMRRAELLSLLDRDLDTVTGEVKITGKRNKQRIVPLGPRLCAHIDRYRCLRLRKFPDTGCEAFLLSEKGEEMNNSTLSSVLKIQLASTSSARKTPHVLRHSFATAMLQGDARLDSVKELLGHSSLATTQIYTHLSFSELQHNYQHAHPRASKK